MFFLEISTRNNPKFSDKFIHVKDRIIDGKQDNEFCPLGEDLNLRDGSELKKCFVKIKELEKGRLAKRYLISAGHGRGFGIARAFFPDMGKHTAHIKTMGRAFWHILTGRWIFSRKHSSKTRTRILSIIHRDHEQEIAQEILWNVELAQAIEGLGKLDIAIFNNCFVTFFDSLHFYSRVCDYLMGTENYLNLQMLRLDDLLKEIKLNSGTITEHTDMALIAKNIFNIYQQGFSLRSTILYSEQASLFVVNLTLMNEVSKLVAVIMNKVKKAQKNFTWYRNLTDSLSLIYLSNDYDLIDLAAVLDNDHIKNLDSTLASDVESLCKFIDHTFVFGRKVLKGKPRLGVATFLPPVQNNLLELNITYREYDKKYSAELLTLPWYQFLEEVKTLQPNQAIQSAHTILTVEPV